MRLNYISITIFILTFSLAGCRKFVEVEAPKTQLVTAKVFGNNESATAALLNIYPQMMGTKEPSPYQMGLYLGLSADELKNYWNTLDQIYTNNLNALDAPTNSIWLSAYQYIYQANAVYEGCNASQTLSPNVKKQLIAEALFIRSFWYFYLVNLYGDVPLITSTDYLINGNAKRDAQSSIYNQIVADLLLAKQDLSEDYLDAKYIVSTQRLRPNKYAAMALLARTYLFMGKYSEAEAEASSIIEETNLYTTELPLSEVFLVNSKEAIWQLSPADYTEGSLMNTSEGKGFVLTDVPATYSLFNCSSISKSLLDSFEPNDLRKTNWIGIFSSAGTDYFYPAKYKVVNATSISEYSVVLRLAEQYLIRAEARAQLGNLPGAIADLDVIRGRANLPLIADTKPNITKAELLTSILHERQIELFTEWGHRWLDLKRTKSIENVMGSVTPDKGGIWKSEKQLLPLPLTELKNDPNLIQNKGYN
ncbi:RagB/SusD family nutrient uptake outer membrane protein [Chitinophaga sp. MM2321]|uniref:RagB/SusD family nutrient uptake outer membrane protein n=1 Tax=Chitinophaga sp. MM2321 TaxID=3137178 RepID=UPI0032D56EEB